MEKYLIVKLVTYLQVPPTFRLSREENNHSFPQSRPCLCPVLQTHPVFATFSYVQERKERGKKSI